MHQKLRDLLEKEGLRPSQFAEMLGVNPAGISHLLAGRNKPGYDLLQKILRRFPRINPDWLLLDSGTMYRDAAPSLADDDVLGAYTATNTPEADAAPDLFRAVQNPSQISAQNTSSASPSVGELRPAAPAPSNRTGARPMRIVICYDDGSFESYLPPQ